jgi:hypothetical protein
MAEQLASGHYEGNPRCEACIERATSRVRQELEAIYANCGDPDAMTVLVQFNGHVSHEVFSVSLCWECVAIATGKDEVRDEYGDRCDRRCATEVLGGERPDLIEAEESQPEAVISDV